MKKTCFVKSPEVLFKRWTRKGASIFESLGRVVRIAVLAVGMSIVAWAEEAKAQDTTARALEEVVVSGQRSPVVYSQMARVVVLLDREEIKQAPVQSINELLEYALNVDMRQRGPLGVQADISIRGGNFDQTMILLNGINITDPQTGHLSMNLPVDLEDIERVEILAGPAARVFGSNAFGGVVNFITRQDSTPSVRVHAMAGQHGLYRAGGSLSLRSGPLLHLLSYNRSATEEGYRPNTDFQIENLFYSTRWEGQKASVQAQMAHGRRAFGANSFYTPVYPEQFEKTRASMASVRAQAGDRLRVSGSAYWRRNHDHFILIRSNPAAYQNFHQTDVLGANFNASLATPIGRASVGFELRQEGILSNNLGEPMDPTVPVPYDDEHAFNKSHQRTQVGYYVEQNLHWRALSVSAGLMLNTNTDLDKAELFPGIDLGYQLAHGLRAFATANRALRMPTFTDLYYAGSQNLGNPDLLPEKAYTLEAGLKWLRPGVQAHAAVYQRRGSDIIDWVKDAPELPWQTRNITNLRSTGFELSARWLPAQMGLATPLRSVSLNYAYLQLDKDNDAFISNYALDNLRHKLNLAIDHRLVAKLGASWRMSWQDRAGSYQRFDPADRSYTETAYAPFALLDARLQWEAEAWTAYVEVANLLDASYNDIGNLPQPGRWLRAGFSARLAWD